MLDFNNLTLESLLRVTPFSNDSYLNMNKELTPEFFFTNFFLDPSKQEFEQAIERDVNRPKRCLVLYGYRGSGKTTFMHNLKRTYKYNMILISIDDYYYENDPIRFQIATYLHVSILDDIKNNMNIFNKLIEILNYESNKNFFLTRIDRSDGFSDFIEMVTSFSNKKLDDEDISNIKDKLMEKRISFLLMMIIFYNLCERLLKKNTDKVFFCLDNIDAIDNIEFMKELMAQYVIFRNNVSFILDNISHPEITQKNNNRFQDYFFIITARESTKAKMNAHLNIDYINAIEYINLSTVFSKTGIFNKRLNYISTSIELSNERKKHIENCKLLLSDSLFNLILPSMFNNDYRKIAHIVSLLAFHEEEFSTYHFLMDIGTPYSRHGARGVIFKLLFEYFMKEEEIKIIIEQQSDILIILNYLKNFGSRYTYVLFDDPTTSLDLLSLSEKFNNIVGTSKLIMLLFSMYNMKDLNNWSHLVTFDRLKINNYTEEQNQKDLIIAREEDSSKYAKVRITSAGSIYLTHIVSHFEFLSVQCKNKDYLFSEISLSKNKNGYVFESIISKVYMHVKELLNKLDYISRNDYLGSMFSYYEQSEDETRVNIHSYERILFTHINYLDCYRLFVLNNTKLEKKEKAGINEKLVDIIVKYIDIFDSFESSQYAKAICENMMVCIITIIDSSYYNINLSIEDITGIKIKEKTEVKEVKFKND